MICGTTCAVALVFLLGTIYVYIGKPNESLISPYLATLDKKQKQKYKEITEERRKLSMQGYGLGFGISLFFILYNYLTAKTKVSTLSMVCLVTSVTLVVNYLYYILSPKSQWMINFLETPEQKKQWLKVYRTMQFNWHAGLASGVLAVALLAAAFR